MVPTGNFGNILAGYYAKRMGIPIDQLVVCTNENDVLHQFFETGIYKKKESHLTIAPSMDISISSNFERYLYYLSGESSTILASWMEKFESTGELRVSPDELEEAKSVFISSSTTKKQILETMRRIYKLDNYLLCPHSATAAFAVNLLKLNPSTTVCLATAHPAKFEDAIELALPYEQPPERPDQLNALFSLPIRVVSLPNSLRRVEMFIRSKLNQSESANAIDGAGGDEDSDELVPAERPPHMADMAVHLLGILGLGSIGLLVWMKSQN